MRRTFTQYILPVVLIIGFTGMSFKTQDNSKLFEITKNLEIFTAIYKELNTHYVDEIDPTHLMTIAIDAMMHSLDPYTVYYSENEIERSRYISEGRYDGIGAGMDFIDHYMTITQLYKGYSADRSDIKVGDQIIAVNGKSTKDMQEDEVSQLLKGSMGGEIALTIYRPVEEKTLDITLTRDKVRIPNVPYKGMVDNEVGYIVLSIFTPNASANIAKAYKELKTNNPELKYLILDIRNNGGGLLNEAVKICNLFIPSGKVVVSTKSKVPEWDKVYKTQRQPLDLNIPLVVLVNGHSASASEIVSGTLQDYDRAVIMGQRTYGKGLVQRKKEINYNSGMKLTIAKYYIPSGRCIQSVEYDENGEPVDIPDSLRAEFKTANGRTVLDGGGIKPDVVLEKETVPPIINELERQHMIMKFVTHYLYKHDFTPQEKGIVFNHFDSFVDFLHQADFTYKTKSEKALSILEKKLKAEAYFKDVDDELRGIHKEMKKAKKNSLTEYKAEIIDLIEEEIMSRFYYLKGKIQQRLSNDKEVEAAIDLLKNEKKYHNILNP